MGRSYSLDLRRWVIDGITGGQSRRGVAEDMSVSASFAVKLVARRERTGSLQPAPQGRPSGTGKLAPYRDFLIGTDQGKARHHDAGAGGRARDAPRDRG